MATRYWVGVDNPGWDNSNTANWSTSSGGAGGASCPTSADDVILDTGGTGERICTVTANVACKTLTMSAGHPSLVIGATPFTVTIHEGGLSPDSSVANFGWIKFVATSGTYTVSKISGNVEFAGVGGTWNLTGANNSFNTLLLTGGTVNFPASEDYAIGSLQSTGSNVRVLNLSGTDIIFKQGTLFPIPVNFSGSNFTFTKGTSNMSFNSSLPETMARTFNGGGKSFNALDLTYAPSNVSNKFTINGSNTFTDLTLRPGYHEFEAGTTQTISGTFTADGGSGDIITIASSSTGTAANLSITTKGTLEYLAVSDNHASGAAVPLHPTNSTNNGGNVGWFPSQAAAALFFNMYKN